MTKEEIKKFLDNTKVYVNGQSWEIQEKLFSLGYAWSDGITAVCHTSEPFIYIWGDKRFCHGNDMNKFNGDSKREITAEQILALEITEPSYRPFKSQEECFEEMQKHIPLGWIKSKMGNIFNIIALYHDEIKLNECEYGYSELSENYMFMDGTPFGIKED